MALPRQVQQELDEAERIQASLAQPTPVDPAPQDPPPTDPVAQPVDAPAPEPVEPPKDAAYWEHRFKTVDGMAKADKARAEEALRTQADQLRQIQAQLESMRQQTPPPVATPPQPLVTSNDEEKFGVDLIAIMRKVSQETNRTVEARLGPIEQYLSKLTPQLKRVEKVESEVAQSREERFWGELANAVPDWEKVNEDDRWKKWLLEYDPVSGATRQTALDAAQATLDHRRAAAMFKIFKQMVAPAQPAQARPNLSSQVAPARNSTASTPPPAARTYTGQEYAYWTDHRRRNDTETAQLVAMQAEMDRAIQEGRVQF